MRSCLSDITRNKDKIKVILNRHKAYKITKETKLFNKPTFFAAFFHINT